MSAKPKLGSQLKQSLSAVKAAPHVVIQALAGTGKTTTLVEGLRRMNNLKTTITPSPQQEAIWEQLELSKDAKSICFAAFNKSIATELQQRVPYGVSAMTMHSLGNKAVTSAFGRVALEANRVQELICHAYDRDLRELRRTHFETLVAVTKLVGLCKLNLLGYNNGEVDFDQITDDELDGVAGHYDVELNGNREEVYEMTRRVLKLALDVDRDRMIDFNDMIWLPVVLNLPTTKYDLMLVDEAQDLNRCQQELACKCGTRLIMCGDTNQAIYGFAGADSKSMGTMTERLEATAGGCVTLPLTVTRRCGKAIVAEANGIVKAFEAHADNPEGLVGRYALTSYTQHVQPGDMVLCRCNAPLVSQCFQFIANGQTATIVGRDVGKSLASLVKKLRAKNVTELISHLGDWLIKEQQKETAKRNPSDARLINLQDKHDCLMAFTANAATVEDVLAKIEALFQDRSSGREICLSSIHKAKGLEAGTVFFLMPENAPCPHPMAKKSWQVEQEYNLLYVGITRAINSLYYVR